MKRPIVVVIPLLLLAAAPRLDLDAQIRRGNDAFAAKDYLQAIKHYEQAEPHATDPGLIAFNKAAAYYQLALDSKLPHEQTTHYLAAAQHYRCATENAGEPRLRHARFGLANSLMQGQPGDLTAVRAAIAAYRALLKSDALDESLTRHARHNLEVAKKTLVELLAQGDPDKPPQESDGSDPKKPPKPERNPMSPDGQGENNQGTKQPRATEIPAEVKPGDKPMPTTKKEAGPGNATAGPKPTPSPALSAAQANRDLDDAVRKIGDRLKETRLPSSSAPLPGVKDW